MPRKTLRAAAMTVLLAACWLQPAQAEDGRPSKFRLSLPFGKKSEKSEQSDAEEKKPAAKSESHGTHFPLTSTFDKLKNAVARKDHSSNVTPAGHEQPAAQKAVAKKAPTQAARKPEIRTAAYQDGDAAPPVVDSVVPPMASPVVQAAPVGPYAQTAPAYIPLPVQTPDIGHAVVPGYPYLQAPLNPCPVPNVPYQVGSTIITNQALYPHEMQYPHEYRAMYPPYYYKVRGGWVVTPWGVWSKDKWELQGTEVKVKYRSNYSLFSGFHPPMLK